MATYGIFEDGELITPGFTDQASAEDHKALMESLPLRSPGTFDVRQLCPQHETHGVDDCPGEGPWANGPDVLERLRNALIQ